MVYTGNFSELISILIMALLYIGIYIFIASNIKLNKKLNIIILIAIFARIILTLTDTYFMYLPNSGADSVSFERIGYELSNGIMDYSSYSGDNYPRFIYMFYNICGRKPLLLRCINGLASMISGLFIYKSILQINHNYKNASKGMALFLLFPHSLIFSSIVLRESFIVLFSTLSIYNFIKYTNKNTIYNLIYCFIFLALGSILHAGIMFISIGYIYYVFKEHKVSSYNNKRILKYFILSIIAIVILFNSAIFLRKFIKFESLDSLFITLNRVTPDSVGSAYLRGYNISSIKDLILFTPLKTIYLLFSPMIWEIRGLKDLIALLLDSIFYIYFIFIIIKKRTMKGLTKKQKLLIKSFIVSLLAVAIVFSLGTIASGTAVRHRYKILNLFILIIFINRDNSKGKLNKTGV